MIEEALNDIALIVAAGLTVIFLILTGMLAEDKTRDNQTAAIAFCLAVTQAFFFIVIWRLS